MTSIHTYVFCWHGWCFISYFVKYLTQFIYVLHEICIKGKCSLLYFISKINTGGYAGLTLWVFYREAFSERKLQTKFLNFQNEFYVCWWHFMIPFTSLCISFHLIRTKNAICISFTFKRLLIHYVFKDLQQLKGIPFPFGITRNWLLVSWISVDLTALNIKVKSNQEIEILCFPYVLQNVIVMFATQMSYKCHCNVCNISSQS